jgi:hypothetical protein
MLYKPELYIPYLLLYMVIMLDLLKLQLLVLHISQELKLYHVLLLI